MQFLQGNNLPRVKTSNQSAILRMIYFYGPIQRNKIAEELGLTLPTITTNINRMLADGLVKETNAQETSHGNNGRPARLLEINAEALYFAGVDLTGYVLSACVTDFCGQILSSESAMLEARDYESVMGQFARIFAKCLAKSGKKLEELCGVGISLPGLVDREEGILTMNPRFQWTNRNVRGDFAELSGYRGRITVENNSMARGISAQLFQWDELKNGQSFAYLLVSSGIACPLFLNEYSHHGSVVGVGEVGHMVMESHGRKCNCGNHGCLEAYAGEDAIIGECTEELEHGRAQILREICLNAKEPGMEEILKAQEAGDKDICRIMEDAVDKLATAAANIINFTRPDFMLIDGRLFRNICNRSSFLEKAKSNLCSPAYFGTNFSFVESDLSMGALGAAAVSIDRKL